MGFDVAIPITESAPYDLVVDDRQRLRRVQCKFSSSRHVDLRRIHSNSAGYVVKRVAENAYDWLYVLRPDGAEFLLRECHAGRRSVTPLPEHRVRAGAEAPP
jgi:PD-(D/E)XK endonuclease